MQLPQFSLPDVPDDAPTPVEPAANSSGSCVAEQQTNVSERKVHAAKCQAVRMGHPAFQAMGGTSFPAEAMSPQRGRHSMLYGVAGRGRIAGNRRIETCPWSGFAPFHALASHAVTL